MENLIAYGGAIKALETAEDGSVTVGGYLVRFGSPEDTDLEGDFFSAKTNFSPTGRAGARLGVFYNHGLDPELGKRQIGEGEIEEREDGLWLKAQLRARDAYERKYLRDTLKLIDAGKAGYSSGAPPWLVDGETLTIKGRKARHITQWPLGEATITPIPAESRNVVATIKSIVPVKAVEIPAEGMNALRERIYRAFQAQHGDRSWVLDVFPAYIIVEAEGGPYRVPFTLDGEAVTFGGRDAWQRVEPRTEWTPIKALSDLADRTSALVLEERLDSLTRITAGLTA